MPNAQFQVRVLRDYPIGLSDRKNDGAPFATRLRDFRQPLVWFVRTFGFFGSLLQVTTTDGEQPDDSFDLIDVPAEMSPPATDTSQPSIHASGCHRHPDDTAVAGGSRTPSPASPTSPISVAASVNRQTPPTPLPASSPTSSPHGAFADGTEAGPSTRCADGGTKASTIAGATPSASSVGHGVASPGHSSSNGIAEGATAPPVTPIIGAHQETRFTFGSGRTPPLPDLRAADFFR